MLALLVVDMQTGCFSGSPPRWDSAGMILRINQLAKSIRGRGQVIFIQHTDAREGLAKGSREWQLHSGLDRLPEDLVVEKIACDAFLETDLGRILKQNTISDLLITGCATDFCVDTTVRSACSHGFTVTVPSDAHTTRDRPHLDAQKIIAHHNYMWTNLLLPGQAKVRVLPTKDLLFELTRNYP